MPMCHMPNCPNHGIPSGVSILKHMTDHHLPEITAKLGFWDLIIAHIKFYPTREATVGDLLGKHLVHVCTGPECGFGSVLKNGVKQH
jgi:hypothetical protein